MNIIYKPTGTAFELMMYLVQYHLSNSYSRQQDHLNCSKCSRFKIFVWYHPGATGRELLQWMMEDPVTPQLWILRAGKFLYGELFPVEQELEFHRFCEQRDIYIDEANWWNEFLEAEKRWENLIEEWGDLIAEERKVIQQRELLCWLTWLDKEEEVSLEEFKGSLGKHDVENVLFDSEGGFRSAPEWPWPRFWAAWEHHIEESKRDFSRENRLWYEWKKNHR